MVDIESLALRIEPVELPRDSIEGHGIDLVASVGHGQLSQVAAVHLGGEDGLSRDVRPVDISARNTTL